MANDKVSVLIAARNEPYLDRTIADAFDKARGEVEVIAVLDGYRPTIPDHKNLILIYHPEFIGQRPAINQAAKLATGKYIFKVDAHCIFDEGYDIKLAKDCKYDWTVIPRRYGVIEKGWVPRIKGRVDYMRLTSSLENKDLGLRAVAWNNYERRTNGKMIDDVMTCQGSGWFLHKDRFFEHGCCDEKHGHFGAMGCEVGCKAWLSGGKLKVNKNTWYAHWQRGRYRLRNDRNKVIEDRRRIYFMPREVVRNAHDYANNLWLNNKWSLQTRNIKWLVDKFSPVPGWEKWQWIQ